MQVPLGKAVVYELLPHTCWKKIWRRKGSDVSSANPHLTSVDGRGAEGPWTIGRWASLLISSLLPETDCWLDPDRYVCTYLLLSFPQSQQLEQSQSIVCIYGYVSNMYKWNHSSSVSTRTKEQRNLCLRRNLGMKTISFSLILTQRWMFKAWKWASSKSLSLFASFYFSSAYLS